MSTVFFFFIIKSNTLTKYKLSDKNQPKKDSRGSGRLGTHAGLPLFSFVCVDFLGFMHKCIDDR